MVIGESRKTNVQAFRAKHLQKARDMVYFDPVGSAISLLWACSPVDFRTFFWVTDKVREGL